MGRSRTPRGSRAGLTRRSFLRGAGALSALAGAQPFLIAGAADDDFSLPPAGAALTGPFLHGVASGDPLSDRVMLWTRITPASASAGTEFDVHYRVATDVALSQVVSQGT